MKIRVAACFLWVLLCVLMYPCALNAHSNEEPIRLYQRENTQSPDYNSMVLQLKSGNLLEFSDGERFRVLETLGHGNRSLILRVQDLGSQRESALRIPLFRGPLSASSPSFPWGEHFERLKESFANEPLQALERLNAFEKFIFGQINEQYQKQLTTFLESLDDYSRNYKALKESGVPVPDAHSTPSAHQREYFLTEVLSSSHPSRNGHTYSLFEHIIFGHQNLSRHDETMINQALEDYMKKTLDISFIGDFSTKQLVFDSQKNSWVLIDWNSAPTQADPTLPADQHHLIAGLDKLIDVAQETLRQKGQEFNSPALKRALVIRDNLVMRYNTIRQEQGFLNSQHGRPMNAPSPMSIRCQGITSQL